MMDIENREASSFAKFKYILKLGYLLICMTGFVQSETSDRILQTSSGAVRGIVLPTLGTVVDAYLGIPYALPPVGERRFRRPVPIPPWTTVYEATMKPPPCYQNLTEETYYYPKIDNMTEDCLYLNIWVPRSHADNSKLKSIMIYIHGGAFNSGSTNMDPFDGAILAAHGDIIVGSINFRIGVFGYFTAYIEGANGNMAIYDQVLALKWINENARVFGGDKNEITLFGESSGGMTVSGFMISPYTQNLFKRGIIESGAAVSPIFFDAPQTQIKASNTLAIMTGCAGNTVNITTDPEQVVSCLRSLPPSKLSQAEGFMKMSTGITCYPIYGDEIMPLDTVEALKNKKFEGKDILMGVNADEGSFFLSVIFPDYFGKDGFGGVDRVSKAVAHSLIRGIDKTLGGQNSKEVADYYMKNLKTKDNRKAVYDVIGDFLISCSTIFFADLYSLKAENMYFYLFSHISSVKPTADWMGSTHSAEIVYVFGLPLRENFNYSYTEEEKEFSRRTMSRFTAFAKTGNPNVPNEVSWPKYRYDNPAYLELTLEEKIKVQPNERCEFWRDRFRASIDTPKPAETDSN